MLVYRYASPAMGPAPQLLFKFMTDAVALPASLSFHHNQVKPPPCNYQRNLAPVKIGSPHQPGVRLYLQLSVYQSIEQFHQRGKSGMYQVGSKANPISGSLPARYVVPSRRYLPPRTGEQWTCNGTYVNMRMSGLVCDIFRPQSSLCKLAK